MKDVRALIPHMGFFNWPLFIRGIWKCHGRAVRRISAVMRRPLCGAILGIALAGSSFAQTIVREKGKDWTGYVLGQPAQAPIPTAPYESTDKADIFAGDWTYVWSAINTQRAKRNGAPLIEDSALGRAGFLILEEVLRQDWLGTSFPNGKTLTSLLRKAGYTGNPDKVKAYFYLSADQTNRYHKLSNASIQPIMAMKATFSPSYRSFGYAGIRLGWPFGFVFHGEPYESSDAGRVRASYYEIVLVSMDAPVQPSRLLADWRDIASRHIFTHYDHIPPIQLTTKVGSRIDGGIVVSARQLAGRPTIRGRLPVGIRLNPVTGKFTGKPRRKGVYRFTVTATYRLHRGEGCSGRYTTSGVIRVVKAR